MREYPQANIQKTSLALKECIAGNVSDIFIIGSSIKNKISPNDIDIVVLFKDKNLKYVEDTLLFVKEKMDELRLGEVHIEHIFADSFMKEGLFFSVFHEGFSIKYGKRVSELQGFDSYSLFTYGLNMLSKDEKVKFSHVIYGRKKDGLLFKNHGKQLGAGSFMIPVENEEILKEALAKWNIKFTASRVIVKRNI